MVYHFVSPTKTKDKIATMYDMLIIKNYTIFLKIKYYIMQVQSM